MGLNIKIDRKWKIKSNSECYIVCNGTTKNKKTGEKTDVTWGYYTTLPQALSAVLDGKIKTSNATMLREVIDLINDFWVMVEDKLSTKPRKKQCFG